MTVQSPPDIVGLIGKDISHEVWREYDFGGRTYRIESPKWLYYRPNGTTHRVVDQNGVVHCVPAPGYFSCVFRWQNPIGMDPVQF